MSSSKASKSTTGFLVRLARAGKIQLVEPNKILQDAYLTRAEESLSSSKTLLRAGNLKDAIALSYYAMYHALLGLFFGTGIKCENHEAGILLYGVVYLKDGAVIKKAKEERIDKQYYVDFAITKRETEEAIRTAELFLSELADMVARMRRDDIERQRAILKNLINGT